MNQPQAGLYALGTTPEDEQTAIPLTGVRVHQRVVGTFAQVTLEQQFANSEQVPVEVVYVFPLETRAAVHGFVVTVGDRLITGQAAARDEAFDTYDDALAVGHGAFLLDQERPNVFTASIGNLEPGQVASVTLKYVTELDQTAEGVRVMIPTTVSPRYVPQADRNHAGFTAADRVLPPVTTGEVPYTLDLTVDLDLLAPIAQLESPSHRISTTLHGQRATVTLAGDDNALDRDFVLLARPETTTASVSRLFTDSRDNRYLLASFRPDLPAERVPVDLVFLVDCSGSMGGASIKQARQALQLGLQSLAPGDRFDVVRFGFGHESLFGQSVPFDDESLNRARQLFEELDADLGGTEILAPLREILGQPATEGFARRVILITDGQVSNEDAVIALATEHRETTRIFTFGVGHGASEHLVRGVAAASGGSAELVVPGERIEDAVMRNFERVTRGCLDNATVTFEGFAVEGLTPTAVPPLAPGQEFTVMARVLSGTEGRAVLSGQVRGETIRAEAVVGSDAAASADFLPTVWARRRLADLEAGKGLAMAAGSAQRDRKDSRVNQQILDLALEFGLLSSETSFIAVEERASDERTVEQAKLRRVPVQLTRGWGGEAPDVMFMMDVQHLGSAPVGVVNEGRTFFSRSVPVEKEVVDYGPPYYSDTIDMFESQTQPSILDEILNLQAADGSWPVDARLAAVLELVEADLLAAARDQQVDPALVGTLVVLAKVAELGDAVPAAWEQVIAKARRWVEQATGGQSVPDGVGDWWEWGEVLLGGG